MKSPRCRCGHKQPTHDKTGCLIPFCRCRSYLQIGGLSHAELEAAVQREKEQAAQLVMEQIERELDEAYAKASGF